MIERARVVSCLAILLCGIGAAEPANPAAERAFVAAEQAEGGGDVEAAERLWRQGMEDLPGDPRFPLRLARLLVREERAAQALEVLDEAAGRHPGNVEIGLAAAGILETAGRAEQALERYREVVDSAPERPEGHLGVARNQHALGELGRAIQTFERGRALLPAGDMSVHYQLAEIYASKHRFDEALALLEEAAAARPREREYHVQIVRIQRRQRRFDAALAALDRAIGVFGACADSLLWWKATVAEEARRGDLAAKVWERAVRCPGRGDALPVRRWGEALLALGRLEEARRALAQAAREDGNDPLAHLGLATIHRRRGDWGLVESELRAAIAVDSTRVDGWFRLSHLLERAGRVDEALGCWDRAIAANPAQGSVHFGKGLLLERLGRREEYLAAMERGEALRP